MGNDDDRYDDEDHDLRWPRIFLAFASYEESEEETKSREFIHGGRG
jgi:hypothetical protein